MTADEDDSPVKERHLGFTRLRVVFSRRPFVEAMEFYDQFTVEIGGLDLGIRRIGVGFERR